MRTLRTASFSVGLAFCLCGAAAAEVADRIVAVVNEEPITLAELDQFLKPIYDQYRQVYEGDELMARLEEARRNLLNQLIEDRLVVQEAKRRGVVVEDWEIDEAVAAFKKGFESEEAFEAFLKAQDLAVSRLRERFKEQISIRKIHQVEIRSRVVVSPQEVEAFYTENQKEFGDPDQVRLLEICIKKPREGARAGESDAPYRKVLRAMKAVSDGRDFRDTAREFSEDTRAAEGGDMGWVRRGELLAEIEEQIFSLEPESHSGVIEVPGAYHIFKVLEKKAGSVKPLAEVRGAVEQLVTAKKTQARYEEWMERLKRSAFISIK